MLYPSELLGHVVRAAGSEPARIAPPGFRSGASACFTTPAYRGPPPNKEADYPQLPFGETTLLGSRRLAYARMVGLAGCAGTV